MVQITAIRTATSHRVVIRTARSKISVGASLAMACVNPFGRVSAPSRWLLRFWKLGRFAPPDAVSVWNEICGELLFEKLDQFSVFPHSRFAQLRIETIVCDVFASVQDGSLDVRLKSFSRRSLVSLTPALVKSSRLLPIKQQSTPWALLLLRFLKLLDARIGTKKP